MRDVEWPLALRVQHPNGSKALFVWSAGQGGLVSELPQRQPGSSPTSFLSRLSANPLELGDSMLVPALGDRGLGKVDKPLLFSFLFAAATTFGGKGPAPIFQYSVRGQVNQFSPFAHHITAFFSS